MQVRATVAVVVLALSVRPVESDSCKEEERDARGNCPAKQAPSTPARPRPTQPTARPTQLDIRGTAELAGAQVSLDGKPVGRAPVVLTTTAGRHLVEVTKDDYLPFSQWVDVAKGERKEVPIRLESRNRAKAAAHYKQGKVFRDSKLYDEAIAEFQAAYAIDKLAAHLFNIADAYDAKGDYDKSIEFYRKYIDTDPRGSMVAEARARVATATLKRDETLAKKGLTTTPPIACPAGMVRVPGGTFQMGSPDGTGYANEHPQHAVTLGGYCIDRTEVTVKAYATCVAAGKCTKADEPEPTGLNQLCNGNRSDRTDHPVNCIDHNQATAYCAWAGKRLPTEAEWEYAAKGSDGRTYPWGNTAPSARLLNACGTECVAMAKRLKLPEYDATYNESDGFEATAPVGSFPAGASPFGALDMAGNVWEWTADWYGPYASGAVVNPTGASSGQARSFRGGSSWQGGLSRGRASSRERQDPSNRFTVVGFRCARRD